MSGPAQKWRCEGRSASFRITSDSARIVTFGLVPMGAGRTYGFAYVIQPRFHDPLEGRLERLRNRFATFGGRVQEYLA
jgi:hypothetical protein